MAKSPTSAPEQEFQAEAIQASHSGSQNMWRNIGLISGREYKNQVTQRSYKIITGIYLAIVIIGAFVPTIIQYIHTNSAPAQTKMVTINEAGSVASMDDTTLTHYIASTLNGQTTGQSARFAVSTETADKLKQTQNDVKNGGLDILLVIDRTADQDVRFTYYTTSGDSSDSNVVQVENLARELSILDRGARQHLSTTQINNLLAQPQFTITNLQQTQDTRSVADIVTGIILAYVGCILMYIAIINYGSGVAQGVAEEKGSHIMEILVMAATPFQMMVGKIIGIGAAGLTQMGILVGVGIAMLEIQTPIKMALLGNTNNSLNISITGTSITMLLLLLLYFILAFALYSSLFAAVGSLVKRQDEARNASAPILMLFMVGYIVSVSIASIPGAPDATWVRVMSYIPFWSPILMLLRIAAGTVAWWEIVMTVALMIIAIPLCAWISARVYRAGILMYGQRPRFAQLVKMARVG